jgi:hypothetical protein
MKYRVNFTLEVRGEDGFEPGYPSAFSIGMDDLEEVHQLKGLAREIFQKALAASSDEEPAEAA